MTQSKCDRCYSLQQQLPTRLVYYLIQTSVAIYLCTRDIFLTMSSRTIRNLGTRISWLPIVIKHSAKIIKVSSWFYSILNLIFINLIPYIYYILWSFIYLLTFLFHSIYLYTLHFIPKCTHTFHVYNLIINSFTFTHNLYLPTFFYLTWILLTHGKWWM